MRPSAYSCAALSLTLTIDLLN